MRSHVGWISAAPSNIFVISLACGARLLEGASGFSNLH